MEYDGNIPKLNKHQFEIFLLIYASHVDYQFTDDERGFILNRCDKDLFQTMFDIFDGMEEFTCLRTIIKYKEKYYPTKESQDELFILLKELFGIDGDYSRIEKVFVTFFQRIKQI